MGYMVVMVLGWVLGWGKWLGGWERVKGRCLRVCDIFFFNIFSVKV